MRHFEEISNTVTTISTWETKTLQTLDFRYFHLFFFRAKIEKTRKLTHVQQRLSSFYNQSCNFNYAITSSVFHAFKKVDDPIFKSRKKADAKNRKER